MTSGRFTAVYTWLGLAVALGACAAGKGASPATSNARSSSLASAGSDAAPPAERPANPAYAKLPPYPVAPADPWRGVVGDQPRRWSEERARQWMIRGDDFECSAARDHCIDPDAWFFVTIADHERGLPAAAGWDVFGPDGKPASAVNVRRPGLADASGWRALRTVPATRTSLVRGAAVVTLERGAPRPTSGVASHDLTWLSGLVDEVDHDTGTFTLVNHPGAFPLWGARVVVLTWEPGGRVQIVGGKQRSELGVTASETFAAR